MAQGHMIRIKKAILTTICVLAQGHMIRAQIRLCSFLDTQHRQDMLHHTTLATVLAQLMPDSLSLEGCKELVSQVTQHTPQHGFVAPQVSPLLCCPGSVIYQA